MVFVVTNELSIFALLIEEDADFILLSGELAIEFGNTTSYTAELSSCSWCIDALRE